MHGCLSLAHCRISADDFREVSAGHSTALLHWWLPEQPRPQSRNRCISFPQRNCRWWFLILLIGNFWKQRRTLQEKKNYKLHHRVLSPKARTTSLKVSLNGTFCLLPGLTPSVEDTQSMCSAAVSTRASSLGPQEVSDTRDIILFQSGEPSRFLLAVPRSTSSWEDGQWLIHCF